MHILITGGTGTIGQRLVEVLFKHGHTVTVLSRQKYKPATLPAKLNFAQWDGRTADGWGHLLEQVDAVVNLAGAGLADERWTDERKRLIRDSRVQTGQAVVAAFQQATDKPKVLIQSSGINYYGPQKDEIITESHPPGNDFLAGVCIDWENSTQGVEAMGVRRVVTRSGPVLDPTGGALPRMLMPFYLFAGGPVSSGRQWFSWIHYLDEAEAIRFLIENEQASGAFNLVAPNPVRNREFAKTVGKVMKRPAFMPVPGLALKLMFGEMATVLLTGQRAVPERLKALGFQFTFPTLEQALQDLFKPVQINVETRVAHSAAV